MYRYNSGEIMDAVKDILHFTKKEAAQTLYEAHNSKRIADVLTVAEAEDFAKSLIAPK